MIKYFTIMVITYTANGEDLQSKVLFPSQRACGEALLFWHDEVEKHFPGAVAVCEKTDIPSASIRPKARPAELTK